MSLRKCLLPGALAVVCALSSAPARASNLEPAGINLGLTSFFDGFGRNEEGFTYLAYLQYSIARDIIDDTGNPSLYFLDPKIDVFLFVNQLVYVLPEKLFGDSAHVGIDFILPFVVFNTSFGKPPPVPAVQLTDGGAGLGDLTFGPLLQFKPITVDGRPVFSHRFELDFIAPTGKYDPDIDINQGSNFVSINPYWAATVLPFSQLEISARFHYLYNFTNHRPALGRLWSLELPPAVKSAQAGQAGWVNFAASYELLHDFHLGVNGYCFMQFNLDLWEMRDGSSNQGIAYNDYGKASFLGIGPGLFWGVDEQNKLFANMYFQTAVKNWPRSKSLSLRWIHGF